MIDEDTGIQDKIGTIISGSLTGGVDVKLNAEMSIEDIEAEYRRVRDNKEIEYVEDDKGDTSYDFL